MDVDERVVFHDKDTMNIYYPFQGFIKNHLDPLQEQFFREISMLEELKNENSEYFLTDYSVWKMDGGFMIEYKTKGITLRSIIGDK